MDSVLSVASSLSTTKSASIHSDRIGRVQDSGDDITGANSLAQLPAEAPSFEAALRYRDIALKLGIAAERESMATKQQLRETITAGAELQVQLGQVQRKAETAKRKAKWVSADGAPARYQAACNQHDWF